MSPTRKLTTSSVKARNFCSSKLPFIVDCMNPILIFIGSDSPNFTKSDSSEINLSLTMIAIPSIPCALFVETDLTFSTSSSNKVEAMV